MCSLPGGMHVQRKWSSSEPNLKKKKKKIHKPHGQPGRLLLGEAAPRRSRRSGGARSRESHIRAGSGVGVAAAPAGAQAGTGRCAARRGRDCDSARPHLPGAGARPPRSPRPGFQLPLARCPPALPLGLFSLRRCASESPSL
ncbi:unnamed protein product [Rangifer tarandus platyrhynchus]|uniref:Uncharacterized protein n=1 Tax=Rangifer tarandus platyrhynchus TaxID=3082113 RepID=A0ABN8ZPU0_RANTA|nr:unnamed protein product [Rangifer tarandus platyrhynchus]